MPDVDAEQFVCTNAEEGESLHRRCGDQSWLFPQEFSAAHLQRIEKLSNTFDRRPDITDRFMSVGLDGDRFAARV